VWTAFGKEDESSSVGICSYRVEGSQKPEKRKGGVVPPPEQ
jgi:hypothetical protein